MTPKTTPIVIVCKGRNFTPYQPVFANPVPIWNSSISRPFQVPAIIALGKILLTVCIYCPISHVSWCQSISFQCDHSISGVRVLSLQKVQGCKETGTWVYCAQYNGFALCYLRCTLHDALCTPLRAHSCTNALNLNLRSHLPRNIFLLRENTVKWFEGRLVPQANL